ncbi:MAG TPA: hypothetical protein VGR57_08655 [Ktedonobacterales bacterium]|nr:hypothetical protein [Ktedonobacterales bacterium]
MSALPSRVPASGWLAAGAWLARLAGNAAGFALCYVVLVEALWALGERYVAPLVPRDGAVYRAGDGIMYTQEYLRNIAWVMCIPSAVFALALVGFALWRRQLWYAPGPLLGLLLGDVRDFADVWTTHSCGGAWHGTPPAVVLLANGLGLVVAARPPACRPRCKELPMPGPRRSRPHTSPHALALLAPLALAALLLAGCENTAGHHVGDTISNAEVRITFTSITVVAPYATFQPAAGDELVRAHVRYTNQGRTVLSFNEVQFAMQNGGAAGSCGPDGAVDCRVPLDGTYFGLGKQGYPGYLLQPGATLESDILFEVGKGAHDARLVYQPDGIEDIANFWWLLGL